MSLGTQTRLVSGWRIMDDVNLFVRYVLGDPDSYRRALVILESFVRDCYPEGVTLERTSEGDMWEFCGLLLTIEAGGTGESSGVFVRQLHKNSEATAGLVSRASDRLFFPMTHQSSFSHPLHMQSSIISLFYRIEQHTSRDYDMLISVVEACRDLHWAQRPRRQWWTALHILGERLGGVWRLLYSYAEHGRA